jgi:hypothetical protein
MITMPNGKRVAESVAIDRSYKLQQRIIQLRDQLDAAQRRTSSVYYCIHGNVVESDCLNCKESAAEALAMASESRRLDQEAGRRAQATAKRRIAEAQA